MILPEHTHAGVVVADLDTSMERLAHDLGVTWADVIEWELEIWTPTGPTSAISRFTYSRGDGPGIELLQQQAGTVWVVDGSSTHHLGFWSTSIREDVATLQDRGYTLVATLAQAAPSGFAYLSHPGGGPLVELVEASLEPRFRRWRNGGRF